MTSHLLTGRSITASYKIVSRTNWKLAVHRRCSIFARLPVEGASLTVTHCPVFVSDSRGHQHYFQFHQSISAVIAGLLSKTAKVWGITVSALRVPDLIETALNLIRTS